MPKYYDSRLCLYKGRVTDGPCSCIQSAFFPKFGRQSVCHAYVLHTLPSRNVQDTVCPCIGLIFAVQTSYGLIRQLAVLLIFHWENYHYNC